MGPSQHFSKSSSGTSSPLRWTCKKRSPCPPPPNQINIKGSEKSHHKNPITLLKLLDHRNFFFIIIISMPMSALCELFLYSILFHLTEEGIGPKRGQVYVFPKCYVWIRKTERTVNIQTYWRMRKYISSKSIADLLGTYYSYLIKIYTFNLKG